MPPGSTLRPLFTALALAAVTPAHAAVLTQWGTAALTGSYACAAACDVNDFLNLSVDSVAGGSGTSAAASALNVSDPNGAARAAVTVVGGLAIPELKAEAFSTAAGGTVGFALGVQAYTYTGGSGTVGVTLDLTGGVNDPNGSDLTGLEVYAAIFRPLSGFSLDDLLVAATPSDALLLLSTYTATASIDLVEGETNPDIQNLGNALTVNGLVAGDQFYLFAALLASADGDGQYADAFDTVSMHFTTGGSELALAAVPLPSGVWLAASGLAGLFILRRRVAR